MRKWASVARVASGWLTMVLLGSAALAQVSPTATPATTPSAGAVAHVPLIAPAATTSPVSPAAAVVPKPAAPATVLAPAAPAAAIGDNAGAVAPPLDSAVDAPATIAPAALAEFVDGVVRSYMLKDGIAGVTVAVVDRRNDLLLRGYGSATLDPPHEVDPATTLFRLGSISKTFTYIATLQLVNQGKLRLEEPVNSYLPDALKLADDGHAPVRLWHLLSHTAGFEDSALGHLFHKSAEGITTLDDYLSHYRPRRVREPGQHAVYSNYAVALLGSIVAHASGEPFEAYVEQHILQPLGMRHSTFREPLPAGDPRRVDAALVPLWSGGFQRRAGGFKAGPFEYISELAPAGGASSTAADMARYMRMLLNGGSLDGQTILDSDSYAQLGRVTYRNGDQVGAIASGFFRLPYGQFTSLEHGGATLYFLSDMVILPDAGVAVFVSTNTDTGRELATTLPRLIFEHFLSAARPPPLPAPPSDFAVSGQRFVGAYQNERRNYSTLEKLFTSLDSVIEVGFSADGYLLLTADGQTRRFVQSGPLSFRAIEGSQSIEFFADAGGAISGLAGAYGHTYADRIGPLDTPATLGLALLVLTLVCFGVLLGVWRRSALPAPRRSRREGRGGAVAVLLATWSWLLFVVLAGIALAAMAGAGSDVVFDYPGAPLRWAVIAAYLAAGLTALAALLWPSIWKLRGWTFGRKLRHSVVLLVMLGAVWLLWHWNVLGAPLALGR